MVAPPALSRRLKILLVEDNPRDVQLIQDVIADVPEPGLELESCNRLSAGLERLAGGGFDAVLLDLSLPDSPWFETFEKFRAQAASVPIVVLTGLNDPALPYDTIRKGAQDYIVKGDIDGKTLVRSILYAIERQRSPARDAARAEAPQAGAKLEVCGFELDPFQQKVWHKGRLLPKLPAIEFMILACLLKHHPEVVSKKTLQKEVWSDPNVLNAHTVQAHIYNIRKALPAAAAKKIVCVPKLGYQVR